MHIPCEKKELFKLYSVFLEKDKFISQRVSGFDDYEEGFTGTDILSFFVLEVAKTTLMIERLKTDPLGKNRKI